MSADNYINIYRCADGRYRAYMGFESDRWHLPDDDPDKFNHYVLQEGRSPMFDVATEDEAVRLAESEYTEYGVAVYDHPDLVRQQIDRIMRI